MNGVEVSFRRKCIPIIALSVMEAELFSEVMSAQDILFVMRILINIVLELNLPIKLEIYNKGSKYITHN